MIKNMENRICLIYNFAQHYRIGIFTLMDRELPIEFVFGDRYKDVKKLDYSNLKHFKKEVINKTFLFSPLYFQHGVLSLLRENYQTYLMLGETICISTWLMLVLSKLYGKKIFFWSHGWYGKESVYRSMLKKIFFGLADGIFLYGNYAKEIMIKKGFKPEKLHVIYNSLDYNHQLSLRRSMKENSTYSIKFRNNNPNLIFIGRLTKVKRIDLILQAMGILRKKSKHFNLTLIGTGNNFTELVNLTEMLKLNANVWFYGACYDETELSHLIYNADLCVSPGNVGLTAMHSMVYGTPVITHNEYKLQMPEFEAIKEGSTGSFFEYNNVDSLADCILNWFESNIDREVIRKNCFNVIDNKYNPHKQLETFKKVLI